MQDEQPEDHELDVDRAHARAWYTAKALQGGDKQDTSEDVARLADPHAELERIRTSPEFEQHRREVTEFRARLAEQDRQKSIEQRESEMWQFDGKMLATARQFEAQARAALAAATHAHGPQRGKLRAEATRQQRWAEHLRAFVDLAQHGAKRRVLGLQRLKAAADTLNVGPPSLTAVTQIVPEVRHPLSCRRPSTRAPRPRSRRTAASSTTSGQDPGDDDGQGEPPPPRLAVAPPPRAIYQFGCPTPEQRGEVAS